MRPRLTALLAWLARRPAACPHCGSVLVAIAGSGGVRIQTCPSCDVTPGTTTAGEVRARSAGAIYRRP